MSMDEVLEFVEENDVKFIRLAFCDIFGQQKNLSIMPQELEQAFSIGINFDSFRIPGYDDPVYQDLYLKPDPSTLSILPWRPQQGRVARFYCDVITADGDSYPYDARKFLKDTLRECMQTYDLTVRVGLRSEFYLFKTDEEGKPTKEPWDQGGYFDIAPEDRGENIRREICLTLEEMGIQPESSHHESGPGQNEIDFKTSDALSAADHFVTYKNVVSAIAARNGVYASFDPKPLKEESGNGLHMRIAVLRNGEQGGTDKDLTERFMAGVYHRMKDITIFLNSRRESYERFGSNEAPRYITWSAQSRSRLLRVPVVRGKKTCFILRSPDSDINPYLAFSMVIRAGMEGLRNQETLPAPLDRSMRSMTEEELSAQFDRLPGDLDAAMDCARNSAFLQDGSCGDLTNRFLSLVEEREKA